MYSSTSYAGFCSKKQTQEAVNLTFAHLQPDVVDDGVTAEALRHSLDVNDKVAGHGSGIGEADIDRLSGVQFGRHFRREGKFHQKNKFLTHLLAVDDRRSVFRAW